MKTLKIKCRRKYMLAICSFVIFNTNSAQEFSHPTQGANQFIGTNMFFQWNSSPRDKHHGFYWNESFQADGNYKTGYYVERKYAGKCRDNAGIDGGEYEGPCPCYNSLTDQNSKTNYAAVYYERGINACLGTQFGWGPTMEIKVKIPSFPIPLVDGTQIYSCPDGSVEITALINSDVFYNERPVAVYWWMVDVSNPLNITRTKIYTSTDNYWNSYSTLKYKFSPDFAGFIEIESVRNYGGNCLLRSPKAVIAIVPGVGLPLKAPAPIVELSCKESTKEIKVPNPHNYDGVYWYDGLLASTPIFDGFNYTAEVKTGVTELYIEYYKKIGSGNSSCEIKSIRSTVYLYSPPRLQTAVMEHKTIYDWRHFNETNCEIKRDVVNEQQYPYYADLEDPTFTNILTDAILSRLQAPGTACLQLSNLEVNQHWEVISETEIGLIPYKSSTNELNERVLRVCSDNLSSDENNLGSKQFGLKTSIKVDMKYCDKTGNLQYGGQLSCDLDGYIKRVMVRTAKPGRINDGICVFPVGDIPQKYIEQENLTCDRRENKTICVDAEITIGPGLEEIADEVFKGAVRPPGWEDMFQYKWTGNTKGLSATDVRNPKVNYSQMSAQDYNIQAYHLLIEYTGVKLPWYSTAPQNYCAFVYKCGSCNTVVDPTQLTTTFKAKSIN